MSETGTLPDVVTDVDDYELFVFFVDGETKTGKGAAGDAAADSLSKAGYSVYHDVAGDFFRRYVALVRQRLGLSETDALPEDDTLEQAALTEYESKQALDKNESLGDLQRDSISNSVSILAKLAISQQFAKEWLALSVDRARKIGANVLVLDGRNLRDRMGEQNASVQANLITVLDLYLTCDPETAAERTLLGRNIPNPTRPQIVAETKNVIKRRTEDRERTVNKFIFPPVSEAYVPGETPVDDLLDRTWRKHDGAELPVSVVLDNSHIQKPAMLEAVAELAVAAVRVKTEPAPVH